MLPLAAAIAAPPIAPVAADAATSAPPGAAPGSGLAAAAGTPSGIEAGLFAVLLAPLAEGAAVATAVDLAGEATPQPGAGLEPMLAALRDLTTPAPETGDDGELLALLAAFTTAACPAHTLMPEPSGADPSLIIPEALATGSAPAIADDASDAIRPFPVPDVAASIPCQPGSGDDSKATGAVVIAEAFGQQAMTLDMAFRVDPRSATFAQTPSPLNAQNPERVLATLAPGAMDAAVDIATSAPLLAATPQLMESPRRQPVLSGARTQIQTAAAPLGIPSIAPAAPLDALTPPSAMLDAEAAPPPATGEAIAPPLPVTASPIEAQTAAPAVPAQGFVPTTPVTPEASVAVLSAPPALTKLATTNGIAISPVTESEVPPEAAPMAPASAAASTGDDASQAIATAPRIEAPTALARSEASQPATSRPEPNPLERAVAHQVSRAIVQHLPDGGSRMVMRLTPPELGTVRIEFIARDGMVTARLMAEDEGVRQALDRALPHIRAEVRGDHPAIDISVDRSEHRHAWGDGHARQERRDEPRTGQGRRQREDDPVFTVDGVEPVVVATPMRAAERLGGRVGPTLVDALA